MTEAFTSDLPFAGWVETYHQLPPYRITTDINGAATFYFKTDEETFNQFRREFDADVAVTQFVACVRKLQNFANTADKRGGILTL